MDTVQARIPHWIGGWGQPAGWTPQATDAAKPASNSQPKGFHLTADESVRFVRLVSECGRIRRHYDIYRWLNGEVQHFLPHEILLSAWGDFANWDLRLDLTSALPGVRTGELAHCLVDSFIRHAYERWVDAARQPVLMKAAVADAALNGCHCRIHEALRSMSSVLVHGVHDKRSGRDSLFIALNCGSFTKGRSILRFISVLDPLFAQVDAAFRRVPAFPLAAATAALRRGGSNVLELSAREVEVLEAMCRGKTNLDIATALDISPFTVKNHVQRIFRKIGVTNRTQAAARYAEAVRQQTLLLAEQSGEALAKTG
jgi:transcriptional regulator EpsA